MTTLPDWLVERAALDEFPDVCRERLDAADPAELAARIRELRERDAAELRAHPPGPAVDEVVRAVGRERQRRAALRRRRQAALLATAGAVAVVVLVIGRVGDREEPRAERPAAGGADPLETTRIKGDQRLLAFRKVTAGGGDRIERLAAGATVRAGDVLQLRFNGGGRRHGVIASIDGAGAVTLHFPESADGSTALPDRTTDLPHAYALDDAPRFERFFFITDDQPIDVGRTLAGLRALASRPGAERAALDLPPRSRQVSLLLRKGPAR